MTQPNFYQVKGVENKVTVYAKSKHEARSFFERIFNGETIISICITT